MCMYVFMYVCVCACLCERRSVCVCMYVYNCIDKERRVLSLDSGREEEDMQEHETQISSNTFLIFFFYFLFGLLPSTQVALIFPFPCLPLMLSLSLIFYNYLQVEPVVDLLKGVARITVRKQDDDFLVTYTGYATFAIYRLPFCFLPFSFFLARAHLIIIS